MPVTKFNVRAIAAIKPPANGRVEYWDSGTPNFGLRISSTGARTWLTMYRVKGRKRRHTLGSYPAMTLADAYEKARVSLNEAANGSDPAAEKRAERLADTFGELATEYLEKHAKTKKDGGREDARILKKDLLPTWKNIKANEIRRRDVLHVLDSVVERGAPVHANRVLALVRKLFNFAIQRDVVEVNPCTAIPLPSRPRARDRVLTAEEIRKVWHAAGADSAETGGMLKLRLLTAQRGGEIEAMAWGDIDLESATWTIPAERAKNGLAHRVPLSRQALDVVEALAANRKGSWVFPSPRGAEYHVENVQKAIQRVQLASGVDFVGHDLRRTAASHMASMGVPRLVISKILNHVETGITAVYDRHSYDQEKRRALEAWGERLREILGMNNRPGLASVCDEVGAEKVLL